MKKIHIILLVIGAGAIAILLLFRGSPESDKPKMIYSKPPVDIEGTVTVTVKKDVIPPAGQLDLKAPSILEHTCPK